MLLVTSLRVRRTWYISKPNDPILCIQGTTHELKNILRYLNIISIISYFEDILFAMMN